MASKGKGLALIGTEQVEDAGPSIVIPAGFGSEKGFAPPKQFSRMSPTQLRNFIAEGLTLEQKRDIEAIGFQWLLELKTDEYPSDLCKWLLNHYNPLQSCLELGTNKLEVGVEDFYLILGLPKNGYKVTEVGRGAADFEFDKLANTWALQFQKAKKQVTVTDIGARLREQKRGGDDFKRNFVILVVSSLLKSNQKGVPNLKILKCLTDVDAIGRFNWCQYALECLNDCAQEWQNSNGISRFTGPALPLVIFYLDRIIIMGRSNARRFPLLCCWDKKEIHERRAYEKKMAHDYGQGQARPRMVIDMDQFHSIEALDSNRQSKKVCIHQVAESAIELSKAFSVFVERLENAKEMFPNNEAISKLDKLAMSMTTSFEEKGAAKSSTPEKGAEKANVDDHGIARDIPMVEDDDIFNDPLFWNAVLEIEKNFGKKPTTNSAQDVPSFSLSPDFPTSDLHELEPQTTEVAEAVNKEKKANTRSKRQPVSPTFTLIAGLTDSDQCQHEQQPNIELAKVVKKAEKMKRKDQPPVRKSPRLNIEMNATSILPNVHPTEENQTGIHSQEQKDILSGLPIRRSTRTARSYNLGFRPT